MRTHGKREFSGPTDVKSAGTTLSVRKGGLDNRYIFIITGFALTNQEIFIINSAEMLKLRHGQQICHVDCKVITKNHEATRFAWNKMGGLRRDL